jgi:putative NADPH-quinone reductase
MNQNRRLHMGMTELFFNSPTTVQFISFAIKLMEDVLRHDLAYGSNGDKLRGKELGLAISAGGKEADYQAEGDDLYTISELTRPLQAMSNLIETKFLPISLCMKRIAFKQML